MSAIFAMLIPHFQVGAQKNTKKSTELQYITNWVPPPWTGPAGP